MLRKLIAIRNVGRFRNSAGPGNPDLPKYVLITGANGYGKTTICAVLRSLKTGESSHVVGRKTLGVAEPQSIEIRLDGGVARFDGAAWSATLPNIEVFDGTFISENVHSGDAVEIDQKRNLYQVIIGGQGVQLAQQDSALAAESRAKTGEITQVTRVIEAQLPQSMTLEAFVALPADPDIDAKIATQENVLAAVRENAAIQAQAGMTEIALPLLPENFRGLLRRELADVAKDAEKRLAEHLAAHRMTAGDGNWIAEGLPHAADTCPFCGQGIQGLPLIAAYRAIFSEGYRGLKEDLGELWRAFEQRFGEAAMAQLAVIRERNRGRVEFWRRFCEFDRATVDVPDEIFATATALGNASRALLERKQNSPLEVIDTDRTFAEAAGAYAAASKRMATINQSIRSVNELIAAKKAATAAADVGAAEAERSRLTAIKLRYSEAVAPSCDERVRLINEKAAIDAQKAAIRTQLDEHTENVVRPYEERINKYLEAFNAGFTIAQTRHGYPGGVASSSYQLVINDVAVDLGDGRTPTDRPSFKNTLSAGDRSTLALSFFLAHLDADPQLAQKVVVFDDPFSSQDAFRRRQTVHEILKIARRCGQIVVLSHDATFVKQVWDKAPPAERVSLALADHRAQGTKISPLDIERACQGRTASDVDDLQAFLATGAGNLVDIVRKMRAILETHCWVTYPGSFQAGQDWLGVIARKIREGGDAHPAAALYEEIDEINDYTSDYYHGENLADVTPDQIDAAELSGYVKRALRIVNASQA